MQIYVVSAGDTIYQIASRFRVSPDQIIYDNQITFPKIYSKSISTPE